MDIIPKGWRESRQNHNGMSYICKNNVILLGVFSVELTKLCSKEVNIFFSFVNRFCCFGPFFLLLNIEEGLDISFDLVTPPPPCLDNVQTFALFFGSLP